MTRLIARWVGLVTLWLLFASTAFAGVVASIQLDGTFVSYTFTDTDGVQQTFPVSPYGANVTYNGKSYYAYLTCLDFANPTDIGLTYSGVFEPPSAFAENEASWLSDRLYGLTPQTADPAYVGPIAMAIWTIMFPSSTNTEHISGVPVDPAAIPWEHKAFAAVSNGYVGHNLIFLADDTTSQRFIVDPPFAAAVPEPGTLLMLGSGVIGLAGIARRKFNS